MPSNENEKILHLRNTISLCLDDLTALVINSALALILRDFSEEVMQMTPGFAFSLRQAKDLNELTQKTLRQYQTHTIQDGDLMKYVSDARMILKDENLLNGGRTMNLKNLFQGKERKKQESLDQLESSYRSVCDQILACEEKMAQCVEASKGHSPDSMVYRANERAYNDAQNNRALLRKQEAVLSQALDNATRVRLVKEYNDRQKEIERLTGIVLGDEKNLGRLLAEAELRTDKIGETVGKTQNFGSALFEEPEVSAPASVSEFGAKVAASERRDSLLSESGSLSEIGMQTQPQEQKSEFSKLVDNDRAKE